MNTAFITLTIVVPASPGELHSTIEQALYEYGVPLRWAMTALDPQTRQATIEAIVTTDATKSA